MSKTIFRNLLVLIPGSNIRRFPRVITELDPWNISSGKTAVGGKIRRKIIGVNLVSLFLRKNFGYLSGTY